MSDRNFVGKFFFLLNEKLSLCGNNKMQSDEYKYIELNELSNMGCWPALAMLLVRSIQLSAK